MVLLHASGLGRAQWGPVAPRLADRYRVLAPDLLGTGESAPWPDPDHFSLAAEDAVVDAVLTHAGEPVHLVGHSYGGLLALRAAERAPSLVRSLSVYEPVAFGVLDGRDPDGVEDLARSVDPSFLDPATGGDPTWVARFINFWNGADAWESLAPARQAALIASGRKSFLEVRALLTESAGAFDVRCPTLVMTGTRSPRSARGVCRVLAAMIPDARLHVFEGAGHMGPIEEAKRFVRVIEEHFGG